MKKLYSILSLILISSLLLAGCGTINSDTSSTSSSSHTNNSQTDKKDDVSSESKKEEEATEEPIEQREATFSSEQAYSDADRAVTILGLKEYKKLKSDKFTDKASKGKKYLVLFLKVKNNLSEKDYFNTNYLTAKLDGKKIENTFLLNEPEGYPTIFTHIESGSSIGGFIVWEVPSSWKKLEISYTGWQPSAGLSLKCTLKKKDLKDPEIYSENDFF